METDKNPFPKIDLFPTAAYVGRYIMRIMRCQPEIENTGAAPYLDTRLYDQEPYQMRLFDEVL